MLEHYCANFDSSAVTPPLAEFSLKFCPSVDPFPAPTYTHSVHEHTKFNVEHFHAHRQTDQKHNTLTQLLEITEAWYMCLLTRK